MAEIIGTNGDDVLFGTSGLDRIEGLGGDDHLYGSAGADILSGGSGVDTVDYSQSAGPITTNIENGSGGDAAGDSLYNIEILIGSSHDDVMSGTDVTPTDNGADILEGGAGADHLDGRIGIDTASYAHSAAGVTVSLATGAVSGGDAQGDVLTAFENLWGSAFADTLAGDAGSNTLEGGAGADALHGGAGIDTASYAHSAAGVQVDLAPDRDRGRRCGRLPQRHRKPDRSDHDDILKAGLVSSTLSGGAGDDPSR